MSKNTTLLTYSRKKIVVTIVEAFLILLIIVILFASFAGKFLVIADPLKPGDAVVPLAGERSRVVYAAELYKHSFAKWYLITDMLVVENVNINYAESVLNQVILTGVPDHHILVATGKAVDTYQEARNIRQKAEEQHWNSLLVVTSPYHTRRARYILSQVFRGSRIEISVLPQPGHWYDATHWWMTQKSQIVTVEEYLKLFLFFIGYHNLSK